MANQPDRRGIFHFLMPGFLGEQDVFRSVFRTPIEKKQDASAQARLTARLQPVMLRRTKDAVAKDLPPKTELINAVELEKGHGAQFAPSDIGVSLVTWSRPWSARAPCGG